MTINGKILVTSKVSAGGVWREHRKGAVSIALGGARGYALNVSDCGVKIVAADERQAAGPLRLQGDGFHQLRDKQCGETE